MAIFGCLLEWLVVSREGSVCSLLVLLMFQSSVSQCFSFSIYSTTLCVTLCAARTKTHLSVDCMQKFLIRYLIQHKKKNIYMRLRAWEGNRMLSDQQNQAKWRMERKMEWITHTIRNLFVGPWTTRLLCVCVSLYFGGVILHFIFNKLLGVGPFVCWFSALISLIFSFLFFSRSVWCVCSTLELECIFMLSKIFGMPRTCYRTRTSRWRQQRGSIASKRWIEQQQQQYQKMTHHKCIRG